MNILSRYMNWDSAECSNNNTSSLTVVSKGLSRASTGGEGNSLSSDEVLQKLFSANNGNANKNLFNGDASGHNNDHSNADMALVNNIAFYTQDHEQIDLLFRQSELMRDKWDEQHSSTGESYGEMTINKALEDLNNIYSIPKTKKTISRAFKLISGSEIIKRDSKTDWLIQNFIPGDSTVLLFGEPASGKSLIALEMACCIASGHDWAKNSVKQGAVAYIAGEGFHGLSKRLNALVQEKELSVDDFYSSESAMDLIKHESVNEVLAVVKDIKNLRLIIIDTLHRNSTGDENSSKDFATILKHCDELRSYTGATILLVHHSGHNSSGRSRGSSAIKGAMDAEFEVSKSGNNVVTLKCTKMKDDVSPRNIKLDLNSVIINEDENGIAITAPILNISTNFFTADKSATIKSNDKVALKALTQLSGEKNIAISKVDWKTACIEKYTVSSSVEISEDTKRKRFSRSLKLLLDTGVVVEDNGLFLVANPDTTIEG